MSGGPHRLARGGRIDRDRPIRCEFDGRPLAGFAGDTLASALLANGITLVGRSFKYHRPRGLLAAGVEEPNALVTVGDGGRTTPNLPATTVEMRTGLRARRQNGWPSVDVDLGALNGWLAPLLPAGFYYKTLMGPRRGSWMWYEPFIRRAAGLGRAVHERDPDRYDARHAFTDVLVIGAGPAGLAAALAAAAAGAEVLLVEQDSALGGSLLAAPVTGSLERWRSQLETAVRSTPTIEVLTRTTALGAYDGRTVALLERHDHADPDPDPDRGAARETVVTLRARAIVTATGAFERPLLFADNDRPGVMLASAARTYLNRYAIAPGRRALVATCTDAGWLTALDLAAAGTAVTVVEQRDEIAEPLVAAARGAGIDVRTGAMVTRALGTRGVAGARVESRASGRAQRLDCDVLCVSGGWSPTLHLTSHTGRKPRYRPELDAFVPEDWAAGDFGAGAVVGAYSSAAAVESGLAAGRAAATFCGCVSTADPPTAPTAPAEADEPTALAAALPPPRRGRGRTFVDLQNDVTVKDVALAHDEGYGAVEHLKRYTTLGMGTDQGRTSNVNAIATLASLGARGVGETGTTTFRPPFTPVSVGALAARSVGRHFRPIRRSPLEPWHLANGATMIEAGPWLRPWFYAWAGADVGSAYREEMRLVRSGVGVSDVSSLGKIDVQGPDAAQFLNRVYVNGFAKLAVGKARYGVMLNDDATVLDDGTTARFGEHRYFMTTTTAQAGEVMSWLEFLLQTAWPELRVQVVSVTDAWAGMSVAGPRAREALERALPGVDVSNDALPHMGVREVVLDGVPLRVLRLSFSGELAYELYVPATRGISLWEHLLAAAAPLGIKPYGLEALASLRIEKGHVAGLELDHRNTLDDLGLGKLASGDKAYVGRALRARPALQAEDRWSLVGLECLDAGARLRGGSILFASGDAIAGHGRGYVTSVTFSTVLGKTIALGLYQGGLRHRGEEIVCAFPLKGETVRARIVSPVFIDPEGTRLHV